MHATPKPEPKKRHGDVQPATTAPVHCAHFGRCGGCDLLDLSYDAELREKELALSRLIATVPSLAGATLLPIAGARAPLFYRNSLKVPFGRGKAGPIAGFYRRGSHRIVDLEECLIQHPALVRLLHVARELARAHDVPIYQEHVHRGLLRFLVARVAAGTGEVLAGLVVRRANAPQIRRMAQALFERCAPDGLVGVVENVNAERTNAVLGPRSRRLHGRPFLNELHDGLLFRTNLASFGQVNAEQASALFAEVLRMLGDVDGREVADLYAGYGPIALRLARAGARVVAVERNEDAARDGITSSEKNGLGGRVRFVAGDAEHGARRLLSDRLYGVVVDPPRRGLGPGLIDALLGSPAEGVQRIVYVSCDPLTLVRDLDALSRRFVTREIRAVDLFPRTAHLEAVGMMERAS